MLDVAAAYGTVGQAEAREALLRGLAEGPSQPIHRQRAYRQLGDDYLGTERFGAATAAYQAALALNPADAETRLWLAKSLRLQGRLDEAIAAATAATAAAHEASVAAWAYAELGAALQARGRLDDSIIAYQEATSLQPQTLDHRLALGQALAAAEARGESAPRGPDVGLQPGPAVDVPLGN